MVKAIAYILAAKCEHRRECMFTVRVRSDQPLQLPAGCDSETASIQSKARRNPTQDATYLFCTVMLFKVF